MSSCRSYQHPLLEFIFSAGMEWNGSEAESDVTVCFTDSEIVDGEF
jgi:hypothetical protein